MIFPNLRVPARHGLGILMSCLCGYCAVICVDEGDDAILVLDAYQVLTRKFKWINCPFTSEEFDSFRLTLKMLQAAERDFII